METTLMIQKRLIAVCPFPPVERTPFEMNSGCAISPEKKKCQVFLNFVLFIIIEISSNYQLPKAQVEREFSIPQQQTPPW
jgi:hypothetical protein